MDVELRGPDNLMISPRGAPFNQQMKRSDFDEKLARFLRDAGRETCSVDDVLSYVLNDRTLAAELVFYCQTTTSCIYCPPEERYEQVAYNVQNIMDELQ